MKNDDQIIIKILFIFNLIKLNIINVFLIFLDKKLIFFI